MSKKGGFELSTNFLVIIIISIAILVLGIAFITRIGFFSEKKVAEADANAKREIDELLRQGEMVAVAPINVYGQGVVVLGIVNDGSVKLRNGAIVEKFGFKVRYKTAFKANGDEFTGADLPPTVDPDNWISYEWNRVEETNPYTIPNSESGEFMIAVNPGDAPSGTYVFDVDVRSNSDGNNRITFTFSGGDAPYKSLLKFYVII